MVVQHRAHGMHSDLNRVSIKGIQPDTPITTLTSNYSRRSTGNISVVDSSSFETFEGVGVGTTNYGYAIINDHELIAYTGVGNGQITGITTRGLGPQTFMLGRGEGQSTAKKSYNVGAQIRKYEVNGINLRRINAFHSLNDVDTTKHPIGIDDYTIKENFGSIENFKTILSKKRSKEDEANLIAFLNEIRPINKIIDMRKNNYQTTIHKVYVSGSN